MRPRRVPFHTNFLPRRVEYKTHPRKSQPRNKQVAASRYTKYKIQISQKQLLKKLQCVGWRFCGCNVVVALVTSPRSLGRKPKDRLCRRTIHTTRESEQREKEWHLVSCVPPFRFSNSLHVVRYGLLETFKLLRGFFIYGVKITGGVS